MTFNPDELARRLQRDCPEVVFALLHGSAASGTIPPGGDVDLAFYLSSGPDLSLYDRAGRIVDQLTPGAAADVGILNNAEPVYRFEALRGRLLFCRDREIYLRFFSLTCREYESQMASYRRQQRYRVLAANPEAHFP